MFMFTKELINSCPCRFNLGEKIWLHSVHQIEDHHHKPAMPTGKRNSTAQLSRKALRHPRMAENPRPAAIRGLVQGVWRRGGPLRPLGSGYT